MEKHRTPKIHASLNTTTEIASRRSFIRSAAAISLTTLLPRPARATAPQMADQLCGNLQNNCVGFTFAISDQYGDVECRAWGEARRSQDPPARSMSFGDKLNVASVSKTITAAACLKALYQNPTVSLNSSFGNYLPEHWNVHGSLHNVTIKQLLKHESGIRFKPAIVDYSSLKKFMQTGVDMTLIGQRVYNNVNYGLLRLIIPRLAKYSIANKITPAVPGWAIPSIEFQQNYELAYDYIGYVQKTVWDKLDGVAPAMACKPTVANPALCYRFPYTNGKGSSFGDMTVLCGSQGWHVTAFQLNVFLRKLHNSEAILPQWLSQLMIDESIGYDYHEISKTPQGAQYYSKGGAYPGGPSQGHLGSYVMGFENGIHLGIIVNSEVTSPGLAAAIFKAYDATYA